MIKVFKKKITLDGFVLKAGYAGIIERGRLIAVTSGQFSYNDDSLHYFVYRPFPDGWVGRWEDESSFPCDEVAEALKKHLIFTTTVKAVKYLEGKIPCISGGFDVEGTYFIHRYEPTDVVGLYYHTVVLPPRFLFKYREEFIGVVGIDVELYRELTAREQ